MSWFSQYVGDPLKALLVKAETAAEDEIKVLAGDVAAKIPTQPITAAAEVGLETAIQGAFDGALTTLVGEVPVVGAVLGPEAVAAANTGIDYIVAKASASLNALAIQAKAKLASYAASGSVPAASLSSGLSTGLTLDPSLSTAISAATQVDALTAGG